MVYKEWPLTSLGGDDSDVVPVLAFPVQFHGCGDEAGVGGDTKQSLRVWLWINGEPGKERVGWEEKHSCVREGRWTLSEMRKGQWSEGKKQAEVAVGGQT